MNSKMLIACCLLFFHLNSISQVESPLNNLNGSVLRIDSFPSLYIDPRTIFVWLPTDYNELKKYAVVYMHDGQMLFDSASTWNQQAWNVDKTMTRLLREETIKNAIVVGIPNNASYRWAEYLPQAILDSIPGDTMEEMTHAWLANKPLGDAYLKFIVQELKPYIDSTYSTLTDPANTCIMGSSMGGIISLYAICEYPAVFGSAACLSTHWPLNIPSIMIQNSIIDIPVIFRNYLSTHLPSPEHHHIYFDYGTEGLDALYKPYQDLVDAIMIQKGYTEKNWMTKEFPGEDHTERAWARRVDIPLRFMLGL